MCSSSIPHGCYGPGSDIGPPHALMPSVSDLKEATVGAAFDSDLTYWNANASVVPVILLKPLLGCPSFCMTRIGYTNQEIGMEISSKKRGEPDRLRGKRGTVGVLPMWGISGRFDKTQSYVRMMLGLVTASKPFERTSTWR